MQKYVKNILLAFVFTFLLISRCQAANIHIDPNPEITNQQIQWVSDAVQRTLAYMANNYDLLIDHDITIKLVNRETASDVISESDLNNNVGGNSSIGKINLIINPKSTQYYITFLTAHELVHQYQMQEYGGTEIMNKNLWFIEGMADYLGVNVAASIDNSKYNSFVSTATKRTINANYSLNNITSKQDWKRHFNAGLPVYGKADMAIIYLNDHFSHNLMWTYMSHLYNEGAETAMKKVYGMSISDLDKAISGDVLNGVMDDKLSSYLDS